MKIIAVKVFQPKRLKRRNLRKFRPVRGRAAGKGMVFGLSVLNRVYNIIPVCPKRVMDARLSPLKGLRHEDFTILGQFCAKIITLCLHSYTKCSYKTMSKILNEFYQG